MNQNPLSAVWQKPVPYSLQNKTWWQLACQNPNLSTIQITFFSQSPKGENSFPQNYAASSQMLCSPIGAITWSE